MKKLIFVLAIVGGLFACEKKTGYKQILDDPETYQSVMKQLTDVIVYDIFSPPVASRVYVYPNIAAFEVLAQFNQDTLKSLGGQLTGFETPPAPENPDMIEPHLASIHAFLKIGQTLIFSETEIEDFRSQLYQRLMDNGLSEEVKAASIAYGELVAKHVLAWADKDNYKQSRTFPKYTVRNEQFLWKPTPPDYMEGIEPHWMKIRPMVLDHIRKVQFF